MKKYLPLLFGLVLILFGGFYIMQNSSSQEPNSSLSENQTTTSSNAFLTLSTNKNQLVYHVNHQDRFMIYFSYVDKKGKEETKGYIYELPDEFMIQRKVEQGRYVVKFENQAYDFDPIGYKEDFKNNLSSHTVIYSIEDDHYQLVIYAIRRDHDLHNNEPIITKISPEEVIEVELTDYIYNTSYGQYLFFAHYPHFDEIYSGIMYMNDLMVYDLKNQSSSIIEVNQDTTYIMDQTYVNGKLAFLATSSKEENGYSQEYLTLYYDGHQYPLGRNQNAYLCEDGTLIIPGETSGSFKRYLFINGELELKEEATLPSNIEISDSPIDYFILHSSSIMGIASNQGEMHYYYQGKWYSKKCSKSVKAFGHYILTDSELIDLEDDHVYPYDTFIDKTVTFQSAYLVDDMIIADMDIMGPKNQWEHYKAMMKIKNDKVNIDYVVFNLDQVAFKDNVVYLFDPNRYDDEMKVQTIEILS